MRSHVKNIYLTMLQNNVWWAGTYGSYEEKLAAARDDLEQLIDERNSKRHIHVNVKLKREI